MRILRVVLLVFLFLLEAVIIIFIFSKCGNTDIEKTVLGTTNVVTNKVWKTNQIYVFASETNYFTNIVVDSEVVKETIEKTVYFTNYVNKEFIISAGGGISINGIAWQVSVYKLVWKNVYAGVTIQNNGVFINVAIGF